MKRPSLFRRLLRWALLLLVAFYAFIALSLAALKLVDPPTTAVQTQRRVESWFSKGRYQKHYDFQPLQRISPQLQWAVVAAEDARFFIHHGFDWKELDQAIDDSLEDRRVRGASTISQQLVKNLFLSTHGSFVRKGLEFTIVPLAELILGKRRILELYLNTSEWGPGVFGAEAAARFHYHCAAQALTRDQAARLAAILPSPLRRRPARMDSYSAIILGRMGQMGH